MHHRLKTWPEYYAAVVDGRKRFGLRANDRDFKAGDVLVLQEYNPLANHYTGNATSVLVTYVSDCQPWLPSGMVCMSIQRLEE